MKRENLCKKINPILLVILIIAGIFTFHIIVYSAAVPGASRESDMIKSSVVQRIKRENLGLVMYNKLSVDHCSIAMDITDDFPSSMSAHECNIRYLNNVYGEKITNEMVSDDSKRIYPRGELFSSAYLNGSKEIRELIRKMLALNYHHRPSAEQIQKHTLHILDSLRTKLKFRMSDYSFYSAYAQFDNEAKNKKAPNLGNTEHRRKSRSNPSNRKTNAHCPPTEQ